jgi:hypothetical protein
VLLGGRERWDIIGIHLYTEAKWTAYLEILEGREGEGVEVGTE